jgi:hypothetical protein
MSPRIRTTLVLVAGIALFAVFAERIAALLVPRDFLEYWAAGRVNAGGSNPYSPDELLRAQRVADPSRDGAVMMWNPPWSLALYMPFGMLPPRWAMLAWIGLQLAAVIASCTMLWRTFGGSKERSWIAIALGLTFAPVVWMVLWGQNTGLVLLGLAGFAYFRRIDRPALAGAFAALTALKPHLLAVFGLLLVVDGVTRRGRIVLLSGGGLLLAGTAAALVANPEVLSQFRQALHDPGSGAEPLDRWVLPVASFWIRIAFDIGFWVQFVPCILAGVCYCAYRLHRGLNWNWIEELPRLVWVSVFATPYGGWIFDLTVLLVPLIALASRLTRASILFSFVVAHLTITAITLAISFSLPGLMWVAPAYLAIWLVARASQSADVPAALPVPVGPEPGSDSVVA